MLKDLWLSMISIIILSGTLALVSLFLWIRVKQKYLLYWTIGWGLYCIHFVFALAGESTSVYHFYNEASDCLSAFSVTLLLFGVLTLGEFSLSKYRWLWILPAINSIWSFYWNLNHNPQLGNLPTSITFGIIQITMGIILLRIKPNQYYTSSRVLGISMLLWGLHKFDRPIIRYIPHLAPYGFLIGSVFAFATAVSMLLLMVEQAGQERDISTERFSTLFQHTSDIIYFYGLDGRIMDANQAAIDKYGYSKEELIGMSILQLRGTQDKKLLEAQVAEAVNKGITFETIHYCKGGTSIPVEVHSVGATIGGQQVLMSTIRDITERKHAEAELVRMNYIDSMTGLYNRTFLEKKLDSFDNSENLPISIIIGDVNGLKFINDAFGHKTGDDLLKEMARLLLNSCSTNDLVIRWGGDEFMLLLPRTGAQLAETLCERIKQRCGETSFVPIQSSIALGYAVKELSSQQITEIIKLADDRMYRNKLLENKSSRNAIISSLQHTLFERSYETEQHAERLKTFAFQIGRIIGLASNQMDDLALLAALHDVGKIAVPEEILSKPGPLSPEEWNVMKKHPAIGHRIIQAIPDLAHIAEAILAHHERWDGKGYPQGLKQTEIPLISRIISIVDSFDAMTNKRVYQQAVSQVKALAEIARCAGSQFDPELANVFLTIFTSNTVLDS